MTEPTIPPFPLREPDARTSPSWTVCDRCGGMYADHDVHQQWHDAVEGRAQRALDLAEALTDTTGAI